MTDFVPPPLPSLPPDFSAEVPAFPWERPPRRPVWPLAVVAGLILAGLFAVGIAIFGFQSFRSETASQGQVKTTLNHFLKLMSQHKESEAYDLFSAHARKTASLEKLIDENGGRGFRLVDGFKHIEITRFELERGAAPRGDAPQGDYAEVSGWIEYDHKPACQFHATFEREGDDWLLYGIDISTHPDELS